MPSSAEISKIVLPEIDKLAAEILQRRPGVAILHTSGYTENAALHQGQLDKSKLWAKPADGMKGSMH